MTQPSTSAAALILARYSEAGRVAYGGQEPAGEALARSYRYWRLAGRPMLEAVRLAELDESAEPKRRRWPQAGLASYQNNPSADGGRWIESPEAAGLRFVGFADEIARRHGSRSIEHSGWWLDPDGFGEMTRGAVYQLPADKEGRPRYVPATRDGSESRKAGGWQDMSGQVGSAVIFLADIFLGEAGGEESVGYDDSKLEAARFADSRAERRAEAEREYQEAWQAGLSVARALEESAEARREFLALRAELKAEPSRPAGSKICAALRAELVGLARSWRKGKKEAAEIESDWNHGWRGESMLEAFAEGKAC